jgi:hypothetical protein
MDANCGGQRAGDGWGRGLGLEDLLVAGPAYFPAPLGRENAPAKLCIHPSHKPPSETSNPESLLLVDGSSDVVPGNRVIGTCFSN